MIVEFIYILQEKQSVENNFVNSKRELTTQIQEVKANECKAKSEAQSWKKALLNVEAIHEKEIAVLRVNFPTK